MSLRHGIPLALIATLSSGSAYAAEEALKFADLTGSPWGILGVVILVIAYIYAVIEERTHLKKSIPVMIAAGVIWVLVTFAYQGLGNREIAEKAYSHAFLEYSQLLLFLLVAMVYVNTLQQRNVFEVLRYKLLAAGLSLRSIFWITGLLAFFLSPVLDNLTTALIMCSVAVAVGGTDRKFVSMCCVSIVVAANAGGAFSPFGDITTLMVWQAGKVEFFEFFSIFLPALVNWLIPATLMSLSITGSSEHVVNQEVSLKDGALQIIGLFALTILISVAAHQYLHMPSILGMMLGFGLLKLYGYFLSHREHAEFQEAVLPALDPETTTYLKEQFKPRHKPFDSFVSVRNVEWDTLLFFYGIILAIAGLASLGYLAALSILSYGQLGATWTNILVGIVSAFVDNIPVMYAILQMSPVMSHNEWMLVTLTAGVGGSLISIGSAAGVALMGYAKVKQLDGKEVPAYTFMSHRKRTPYIFLGFVGSIVVHLWTHGMPMPF